MSVDVDREVADLRGPAGLPRKNGELVFNQPWEGRAFGLALAVRAGHRFPWSAFRERLEKEVAAAGPGDDGSRYYELWLRAFEALLVDDGLVSREELDRRAREYLDGVRDEVF
jgi:nitrile hydratase accessory protein